LVGIFHAAYMECGGSPPPWMAEACFGQRRCLAGQARDRPRQASGIEGGGKPPHSKSDAIRGGR